MKKYASRFFFVVMSFCVFAQADKNFERNDIKTLAFQNTKTANEFMNSHEYDKALEFFKQALNYNIMVDNIPGMIKSQTDIGKVYIFKNDFKEALKHFNLALVIAKDNKEYKAAKAYVLSSMGDAFYFLKQYDEARDNYQQAFDLEAELKNLENQGIIIQNMAKIQRSMGNFEASLKDLLSAAKLFETLRSRKKLNNYRNLSQVYYSIGQSYSKLDKTDMARQYILKALEIDKFIENSGGIADDYYALGMIYEKSGKNTRIVIKHLERSRDIYRILDNVTQFSFLSSKIGDKYLEIKEYSKYFDNKIMTYKLAKPAEKPGLAEEMLAKLDEDEIKTNLSAEEIKKIRDSVK